MNMVYRWKPGAHVSIAAQAAGEELEKIRVRNNGRLESALVVDAARPETSPLHAAFEWSDKAAAEQWRAEQARFLIRSVEIVIDQPDRDAVPIRAFVSVKRDEDRSFTSTVHALADPDLRAQVIEQAWRELEAWRQRHAELIEFGRVFSLIDQARSASE